MVTRHGHLRFPHFRRLLLVGALARSGLAVQAVAATYLVFTMTQSAADVGLLAAVALFPAAFGPPVTGTLMERFCPRKMAITLALTQAAATLVMAALAAEGKLSLGLIYLLIFIGGACFGGLRPLILALFPYTVPPESRGGMDKYRDSINNFTAMIGALASAVVVNDVGEAWAFALAGLTYFALAAVLILARSLQEACDALAATPAEPLREGLAKGLAAPIVRLALLTASIFFLFVAPIENLIPRLATAHGESAMYVGAMVAAFAFGALAASLFGDFFTRTEAGLRRELEWILVAVAFVLVALSLSMSLAIDMALLALLGAATELTLLVMPNLVIIYSPNEVKGRMLGIILMTAALMVGVGTYLFGYLIDSLGLEAVLIGSGVVLLVYALALLSRPLPLPTGSDQLRKPQQGSA